MFPLRSIIKHLAGNARTLITTLLLTASIVGLAADDILDSLDFYLSQAERYDAQKETSIRLLRRDMVNAHDDEKLYKAQLKLFDAYASYKYDSASVYAERALSVAKKLRNADYMVIAKCDNVFCLSSAGLYKEAFDVLETIDISPVGSEARKKYYLTRWRLLADIADYDHVRPYQNAYIAEARQMADTLKTFMATNSVEWKYIEGLQQMNEFKYSECVGTFLQLVDDRELGMHQRAIITSILGWIYKSQGDDERGLRYLVEAAICDIKSSTKETTALREVGALIFKRGDFTRASTYVQKALDDANFYNARQRKIEIGNILPIIQQDRYNVVRQQRNTMVVAVVVVLALLVALLVLLILLRKQMLKLRDARNTIAERNREIERNLGELQEANKIKTEYIGKSFFINVGYIDKVEKLYRDIDRKISAHQYDSLRRSLNESTLIAERKSMYADFDEAFLTLFPHFTDRYNALFAEQDRKLPTNSKSLTTEMRIFALIRLGISDAERIAQFLNYSVNTINTYKTRVKNKSIVSNYEFEQRIMAI